ncbi:MAG TPA: hypothetical protein VF337_01425 [Candidatus Limnocylindrales bacterium]
MAADFRGRGVSILVARPEAEHAEDEGRLTMELLLVLIILFLLFGGGISLYRR